MTTGAPAAPAAAAPRPGRGRGRAVRDGLDPAAVRALGADDLAALLLRLGHYRVEPATGAVVPAATGRPLVPQRNPETGYSQVQLSYRPVAVRTVAVHRLVAVAAWGVEAVRGRHVVHRDGDRAHNAVANLALVDPPPPTRRPGPGAPRVPRAPPRARGAAPRAAGPASPGGPRHAPAGPGSGSRGRCAPSATRTSAGSASAGSAAAGRRPAPVSRRPRGQWADAAGAALQRRVAAGAPDAADEVAPASR